MKANNHRSHSVWCVSRVQHLLRDPRSIDAFMVAQRYTNGDATGEDLAKAHTAAKMAEEVMRQDHNQSIKRFEGWTSELAANQPVDEIGKRLEDAQAIANALADVVEDGAAWSAAAAVVWLTDDGGKKESSIETANKEAAECAAEAVSKLGYAKAARHTAKLAADGDPAGLAPLLYPDEWGAVCNAAWHAAGAAEKSAQKAEFYLRMEQHAEAWIRSMVQPESGQTETLDGFIATREDDGDVRQPAQSEAEQPFGYLRP